MTATPLHLTLELHLSELFASTQDETGILAKHNKQFGFSFLWFTLGLLKTHGKQEYSFIPYVLVATVVLRLFSFLFFPFLSFLC